MKYKHRIKDLLSTKDPETLLRKAYNLTHRQAWKCVATKDEVLCYIVGVIKENPDLKKKIQDETKKKKKA